MPKTFIEVSVDKVADHDGVSHSHVTGTHGLSMWVPTSELVNGPEGASEELAQAKELAEKALKENEDLKSENEKLTKAMEAAKAKTKAVKSPAETKDVKAPEEKKAE